MNFLWRKWYVLYPDGKVSNYATSKKVAIKTAQCWDGITIFSVVKILGIEFKREEKIK